MSHRATGTFEVKLAPLQPYVTDDPTLGRFSLDKQYQGNLEGSSKGEMLSAGKPPTAGAVAIEKVAARLDGRSGTFVLEHYAIMEKGKTSSWSIVVVPGSGTGELAGIAGKMEIIIENNKHSYALEYTLP
ncbi:MAG: DUF3224 domain-containing protein [Acidobacteria bacterium]|nr:DUF3224 domain-containing protein [Acidobacteriota bacterium]